MGEGARSPEALLARGELLQAAGALSAAGRHLEAAKVYEKLCLDAEAAREAFAGGDVEGAHAALLRARDWAEAARVRFDGLRAAEGPDADRLSRIFARDLLSAGRPADAAALFETVGDLEAASSAYRAAGALRAAARLEAFMGRFREAADLLAAYVDGNVDAYDAAAMADQADARLALGRVLIRAGRPGESVVVLQSLLDDLSETEAVLEADETAAWLRNALGLLVRAFDVLAHPAAAESTWRRLVPLLDDPPADYRTWLLASDDAPEETGDDGEGRIVGGRYRLGGLLGAGSAGQVYRARDEASGRDVALKLVAGGGIDGGLTAFFREARVAASLDHPGLVRVLEAAPDRGYLVMEYLPGGTLADRLRGGRRLSAFATREVGRALADILGAVHRRGVLHRDLKPENVLFDEAGRPRLGDLGAAHLISFKQTATGYLLGTLAYMAPEQLAGESLSAATDLWGLAVMLYRALTGRLPFPGPDVAEQHREGAPAPSEALAGLPDDLRVAVDAFFARAFALDPAARFPDASSLSEALLAWPEARQPEAEAAGGDAHPPAARRDDAAFAPLVGSDRYSVQTRLGARVSLARDRVLHRPVAIERVPAEGGAAWLERVAAVARTGNPNLQPVLDVDPEAEMVVWAWLEGIPLAEVARRPVAMEAALRIGADLASALVDHPGVLDPEQVLVVDGRAMVILAGQESLRSGVRPADDARPVVGRVMAWACDGADPGETAGPIETLAEALGEAAPPAPAELARWLASRIP
jgi:eukaryotic-like serine/threonine-protein kinase